jgi:hypothetical protein
MQVTDKVNMTSGDKSDKVHVKAILLGVLMMPIHSYWISKIEAIVLLDGQISKLSID